MTYDWIAENRRIIAENERRQELLRQERFQRDLIAEQEGLTR
jgi:hypothetical protein